MKRSTILKRVLILVNMLFSLGLVLPIISLGIFAKLALLAPLFVFINVVCLVFWAVSYKRYFLISTLTLIIFLLSYGPWYKWSKKDTQQSSDLSIMTFNVMSFNNSKTMDAKNLDTKILNFVDRIEPDIICFQEFYHLMQYDGNFDQYPYRYVDFNEEQPSGKVILAIFSKYPLLQTRFFEFPNSANNAMVSDILVKNDTLSLYNVHYESFSLMPVLDQKANDPLFLLKRLHTVLNKQKEQAQMVKLDIAANKNKVVICGDFNNTQNSKIYKLTKGNLTDTFSEAGEGFGRSFSLTGLPLRIDYILADEKLEVTSHTTFDEILSDHYPVMATLKIKTY